MLPIRHYAWILEASELNFRPEGEVSMGVEAESAVSAFLGEFEGDQSDEAMYVDRLLGHMSPDSAVPRQRMGGSARRP